MPPPLQIAATARADYSRNSLTYSDPTGEKAIRNLLQGGGPFQITAENGFRIFANREALDHMLLGMKARVSRGGKLWVEPIPAKNERTPVVNDANHSHRGGPTQNTNH